MCNYRCVDGVGSRSILRLFTPSTQLDEGSSCGGLHKFIFYPDHAARRGRDSDAHHRITPVERRTFSLWAPRHVYKLLKVKRGRIIKLYSLHIIQCRSQATNEVHAQNDKLRVFFISSDAMFGIAIVRNNCCNVDVFFFVNIQLC